jgi:hypothetical protein
MHAIRAGHGRDARRAALAIDDALDGIEPRRIREYFDSLFHWFCPDDEPGEHLRLRQALHDRLEEAWPAGARRTRGVLVADRTARPFRWSRLLRRLLTLRFRAAARTWRRRWDVPVTPTASDPSAGESAAPVPR